MPEQRPEMRGIELGNGWDVEFLMAPLRHSPAYSAGFLFSLDRT